MFEFRTNSIMELGTKNISFDLIAETLNKITIPILIIDKNHVIRFQNRTAEELFHSNINGLCWKELWKGETLSDEHKELFFRGKILPEMHCYFCAYDYALKTGNVTKKVVSHSGKYLESYWVPINDSLMLHYFLDITDYKKEQKELKKAHDFIRTILDIIPDFIWAKDLDGKFVFINKSKARTVFFSEPEEVVGKTVSELLKGLDEREKNLNGIFHYRFDNGSVRSDGEIIRAKKPVRYEKSGYIRGKFIYLDIIKVPWRGVNGQLEGVVGVARDITKLKLIEKKMREQQVEIRRSLEYHRALFTNNPAPMAIVDENRIIVDVNPALCRALGYEREELVGESIAKIHVNEKSFKRFGKVFYKAFSEKDHISIEYSFRKKDGSIVYAKVTGSIITLKDGKKGVLWSAIDVTDLHRLREKLEYLAMHDVLTGLNNRYALDYEIERIVARANRYNSTFVICMIDLDDFKSVNDTYGHNVGDEVLRAVARRLKSSLRSSDFVARLGGDEFVALIEDIKDRDDLVKVLKKIEKAITLPIEIDGITTVKIGVSMGVYLYHPDDDKKPKEALRCADIALYESKNNKDTRGESWVIYTEEVEEPCKK